MKDTGLEEAAKELGIDLTPVRAYARMINGVMEIRHGKNVMAYAVRVMPGLWEYVTYGQDTGYVSGDIMATACKLAEICGLPELYSLR